MTQKLDIHLTPTLEGHEGEWICADSMPEAMGIGKTRADAVHEYLEALAAIIHGLLVEDDELTLDAMELKTKVQQLIGID